MERKITYTRTEGMLTCPYCGVQNPLKSAKCKACGGVLTDAEMRDVPVERSTETTTVETNFEEIDRSVDKAIDKVTNRVIFIIVVLLLIAIGVITWITSPSNPVPQTTEPVSESNKETSTIHYVTITDKSWLVSATYETENLDIQVGYYLPNGATLISQRQVSVEDNPALFRTEYTYTLSETGGVLTFSGTDTDPIITADEIAEENSCTVVEYNVTYYVRVASDNYTNRLEVKKSFWDSVNVGDNAEFDSKTHRFLK